MLQKYRCHSQSNLIFPFRGECNGKSGVFPAPFVRVVDSFPGDLPPQGADISCYLKAQSGTAQNVSSSRNHNDYMNTRDTFPNLTESLKALEPSFTGKLTLLMNINSYINIEILRQTVISYVSFLFVYEKEK